MRAFRIILATAVLGFTGTAVMAQPMGSEYGGAQAQGLADMELRIQELERENSQLNGSVERLGNALQQMARRFDKVIKDYDLRLQDLENRPAAVVPQTSTVPAGDDDAGAEPAKEDETAAIPANLSPNEHYNRAYAYLTSADYPNAEKWLNDFIKKFPKDKLGDNAYYWLGEVYLVENNPTAAVKAFRGGLQAFPKGTKAPANLLKMGVALQQLKQPEYARGAWEKLVKDFPRTTEAQKAKEHLLTLPKKA